MTFHNLIISAICGFISYYVYNESGLLASFGWILCSGYYFLCQLIQDSESKRNNK